MTIRSGRSVSSIAQPSRRNSGFETTSNGTRVRWWRSMTWCTKSPVPTGTVDLFTTTVYRSIARPIARATDSTAERSVCPLSLAGVPTVMKTTTERRTASARSVVNASRPSATLRATISSRPGS